MTDRRIVVGVDGSPSSAHALDWAVRDARTDGAHLQVVLVWDTTWLETAPLGPIAVLEGADNYEHIARSARERLDQLIAQADTSGLRVTAEEIRGTVVPTILERGTGADRIVVGRRGLGRLGRLFMGSVSAGIVRQARVPVTIIPDPDHAAAILEQAARDHEIDETPRVVVGVDGSDASVTALRHGAELATRHDLPLHAVACWQVTTTGPLPNQFGWAPPVEDYIQHTEELLARAIAHARLDLPEGRLVEHVEQSAPARGLLRTTAGARHLVLGSRGLGGFERLLLGSVSSQMVEHTPCPVTVVRA